MGATSVTTLLFDIVAHDKASEVFKGLATTVGTTGTSGFDKWKAAGVAAALAVAGAATAFGKESVDAYKSVGGEVLSLQRVMGGTAEDVSRLRFAAKESGVDFDTMAKGMKAFAKSTEALAEAQDKDQASTAGSLAKLQEKIAVLEAVKKPTDAQLAQLDDMRDKASLLSVAVKSADGSLQVMGVTIRDAAGKALPMAQVLPELAGKFAEMPNGPEKTALAMKVFGKAGADLLPMLNKGKEGLAELAAESDKFGLTLSGPQLDALKKSKAAQREWDASIEGVKVQFGAQLLPVMTTVITFITERLIPGITTVTTWMQENSDTVKVVAIALGVLSVAAGIYTAVQWAMNSALLANPITWVVVAIVALGAALVLAYQKSETFRNIVDGAMRVVGQGISWLWENVAKPAWEGFQTGMQTVGKVATWLWNNAFQPALSAIVGGISWLLGNWATMLRALGNVPGFEWAKTAADTLQGAADKAAGLQTALKKIDDTDPTVTVTMDAYLTPAYKASVLANNSTKAAILETVAARASGGPVQAGVPYLVGEQGPELAVFDSDGSIIDAATTASIMAGRPRPAVTGVSAPAGSATPQPNVFVRVFVGGRELLEDVRVVVDQAVGEQLAGYAAGMVV